MKFYKQSKKYKHVPDHNNSDEGKDKRWEKRVVSVALFNKTKIRLILIKHLFF